MVKQFLKLLLTICGALALPMGPASERDPAMVERDIARGYYTDVEAVRLFTRAVAAE